MSHTVSVRVEPTIGRKAAGQVKHDLRQNTPDYVDQDRTKDNSIIIEPPHPSAIRQEIEANRKASGQQKLRGDARTTVRGIITFGTEAQRTFERLPRERQDALYQKIAARISKETGHDLIGLVVHRDEAAGHAHFMLRGYRLENGKEQPWRHGREMMSKLQDVAAEELRHIGIERGTPKQARIERGDDMAKVVHRSVRQLHQDLPKELERKAQEVQQEIEAQRQTLEAQREAARQTLEAITKSIEAEQAKAEKNRRLIHEQEAKLAAGKVSEEQAQKRTATYERREADAAAKVAALEKQAAELQAKLQPIEQDLAKQHPMPTPPQAQTVEVVTKDGFFTQQRETREVIPAEAFRQYQQNAEMRQQRLVQQAAQAEAKAQRIAQDHAEMKTQHDRRGMLLDAIARSPIAEKLAEHLPAFAKWVQSVRERDAQAQAKTQAKAQQRGYDFER
ncbi:plasmid recombination protein [Acidithiobacillus acidisediminis]|uniref:plasmid recombination protein n=1 Tax=Acidithiobacillus acidisediminis TaxID=2937799 RepID=UPI00200CCBCE|nr:plasmid recombination protein [Acidithiobacillus sp. S30A2]